jgi:REP element-mobilizing transposase RayT
MPLKSTSHTVYEAQYHIVWYPMYRKKGSFWRYKKTAKGVFYEIAQEFDFEIDKCEAEFRTIRKNKKFLKDILKNLGQP